MREKAIKYLADRKVISVTEDGVIVRMKDEQGKYIKMTQNEQILFHLILEDTITTRDATLDYGIYRLSARIYDLQKEGFAIHHEMVTVPTRNGETEVAQYSLEVKDA